MRRLARRLFTLLFPISLVLLVAMTLLWARTEAMGRIDHVEWGNAGVYRCLEFREAELHYRALYDPGFAATPLRWRTGRGGWPPPPKPSVPNALPSGSTTWFMPLPGSLVRGSWTTEDRSVPGSQRSFTASDQGGVARLARFAEFAGWYGPGTALHSYSFSYFLVLVPASVFPAVLLVRFAVRRLVFGRYARGLCRSCGYDLRATPGRCPECGTSAAAAAAADAEAPAAPPG